MENTEEMNQISDITSNENQLSTALESSFWEQIPLSESKWFYAFNMEILSNEESFSTIFDNIEQVGKISGDMEISPIVVKSKTFTELREFQVFRKTNDKNRSYSTHMNDNHQEKYISLISELHQILINHIYSLNLESNKHYKELLKYLNELYKYNSFKNARTFFLQIYLSLIKLVSQIHEICYKNILIEILQNFTKKNNFP